MTSPREVIARLRKVEQDTRPAPLSGLCMAGEFWSQVNVAGTRPCSRPRPCPKHDAEPTIALARNTFAALLAVAEAAADVADWEVTSASGDLKAALKALTEAAGEAEGEAT